MARTRKRAKKSVIHKTRKHARRKKRASAVTVYAANPRHKRRRASHKARRHSSRRKYRSNPMPGIIPSMGFLQEVGMVAGGYYATKISAGFVLPMVGIAGDLPRIAVKGVVAWGVAFLGGKMLGSKAQQSLLIGGALEVMQDAIKTYVSPFVPALAAADMQAYYAPSQIAGDEGQNVSSYYQVGELPSDNYAG